MSFSLEDEQPLCSDSFRVAQVALMEQIAQQRALLDHEILDRIIEWAGHVPSWEEMKTHCHAVTMHPPQNLPWDMQPVTQFFWDGEQIASVIMPHLGPSEDGKLRICYSLSPRK